MSEGESLPASSRGSWSSFLKSIASFNGDLASLTAPPFILSSTSLVEFSAYWAEHPEILIAPTKEEDPEKRALAVLKWFLSTLKQQYSSRNEKFGSEKKPLNPFLGELFLGKWDGPGDVGETVLISEQVSHHPPVTAYCIINDKHGVKLQGYNGQKASFSTTINGSHPSQKNELILDVKISTVKQVGYAKLHLEKYNEDYFITLPSLHIEGLVYGSPYVELNKYTVIQSSTGYTAKIEYSGKGWVSGKKNSFTATMSKNGSKDVLYKVEGQWSDAFVIKQASTKKEIDSYNAKTTKTTPLTIKPLEEQDPLESRNAWSKVAAAIAKGDYDLTGVEKSKIENAQRELRKKEKADGTTWHRRYFSTVEVDEKVAELSKKCSEALEDPAKTGGIWVFDETKYEEVKSGKAAAELKKTSEMVLNATNNATPADAPAA